MSATRRLHRSKPAPDGREAVPTRIDVAGSILGFRSGPALHTRAGAGWVGACAVVITGLALFIMNQNMRTTDVSFLVWRGQFPLAVALLASALLGAGLTLVLGSSHSLQPRRAAPHGAEAGAPPAAHLT
jgi:uncharacterized integral membrane protein